MTSYWGIFLIVLLILIWIITGGYITQSNVYLREFQNTDKFFKTAYNYTFWAAFITWFLVALFILLIILAVVGVVTLFSTGAGEAEAAATEEESLSSQLYKQYQNYQPAKADEEGISWTTIVAIFFALVLVIITGILAAYSAEQIKTSTNFTESNNNMKVAYDDCVIAAIICLSSAGLLILSAIIYFFIGFFNVRKSDNATVPPNSNLETVQTVPAVDDQKRLEQDFDNVKQKELENSFKQGKLIK